MSLELALVVAEEKLRDVVDSREPILEVETDTGVAVVAADVLLGVVAGTPFSCWSSWSIADAPPVPPVAEVAAVGVMVAAGAVIGVAATALPDVLVVGANILPKSPPSICTICVPIIVCIMLPMPELLLRRPVLFVFVR